ncbi:NUDIX domain-containing protein [Alicyclobacillus acidiphilus]|uniref:NUDIX domain-containing protein n=1 Tax=Alicyclobacillus acidiphilus TaxID=182455 RepID=UPI001FE20573|nr:NUDIX domain-containing protein [Alicyclobacillus acidiphilus]
MDTLQIIVNCFVAWEDGFVMLQKPRRGWWYLPGGKVEDDELWRQAAIREFHEESGLTIQDAELRGVYRVHIDASEDSPAKERMIAQFVGRNPSGTLLAEHREGRLAVIRERELEQLPMDEGDRMMLKQTLAAEAKGISCVSFGRFRYDAEHRLLAWEMDSAVGFESI